MRVAVGEREPLLPAGRRRFGNCHASTLASLPGGDLIVAFFAGTREGEGDTAVWLASRRGERWLAPEPLFGEPGLPHWNPVLHAEGARLWLFYKVGASVHVWRTRCAESGDGGATWSPPRDLVPGDPLPRGPVKNKLVVLSNGDWLAPGSIETASTWRAFVDVSVDRGRSWRKFDVPLAALPVPAKRPTEIWSGLASAQLWENDVGRVFGWDGVIQPTLWESASGTLHMLLRSTRGHVYRSDSSDRGRSWCEAYATALPNNNSGIDVARLASGILVLACNPVAANWGRRYPLSLLFSADDGTTWNERVDVETDEGEFSYPAIIDAGDALHLCYTANRTNIVHRHIDVAVAPGSN
jgi:predicted neuraminidase